MAYSITSQSGQTTYKVTEYVVNTESDVASVPIDAASGSTILVLDTAQVYMLSVKDNGTRQWKLLGGA